MHQGIPSPEIAPNIDPGQIAGGSCCLEVHIDLRLDHLFMDPYRVDSCLRRQIMQWKGARKLPLAIDLLGAAHGAYHHLYLIGAAGQLCRLLHAIGAKAVVSGLAAAGADGLHHIRTI